MTVSSSICCTSSLDGQTSQRYTSFPSDVTPKSATVNFNLATEFKNVSNNKELSLKKKKEIYTRTHCYDELREWCVF